MYNVLLEAIRARNSPLALLLIEYGATVTFTEAVSEESPLWAAVEAGLTEVVGCLLKKGTNPGEATEGTSGGKVDQRQLSLRLAALKGYVNIVNLLLDSSPTMDVNEGDEDGTTPLMLASWGGHLETVLTLLRHKSVSVNQQNSDGHTALMFAYLAKSQTGTLLSSLQTRYGALPQGVMGPAVEMAGVGMQNYRSVIQSLLDAGSRADIQVGDASVVELL